MKKKIKKAIRNYFRKLYYIFPERWRPNLLAWAIKIHPSWFKNHPKVLNKKIYYGDEILLLNIDIYKYKPVLKSYKLAIHCHIFYIDLISEFIDHLSKIPFRFDLFVSVPDKDSQQRCQIYMSKLKNAYEIKIKIVPNRGRDLAPMFAEFGQQLKQYDYLVHLHSKKSIYNKGVTDGWRSYLFNSMFGSAANIQKIYSLLIENNNLGIIYPQIYHRLPYFACTWLANKSQGQKLLTRMQLPMINGYFNYPVGSMFWAKTNALMPLFDLNLKWEDFPEERGQTDGTLAHALERLLGIVPPLTGYNSVITQDLKYPAWSSFRIDTQYLTRDIQFYKSRINKEKVKVVAFDIFDTLLVRPLLNPDHTKKIISQYLDDEYRMIFKKYRVVAETQARSSKGKDVSLNEIYVQFKNLSQLTDNQVEQIKKIEERVELASVSPRYNVIELMQFAKNIGKKVILISDMFLSRKIVERMLSQHGITEWHNLYLSSETGVRKDTGELYKYMLNKEDITGREVVMIGDNERSDIQLPTDEFGIKCIHILRAADLACALPDYFKIIKSDLNQDNINNELTIGLLVRKNLNNIYGYNNSSEKFKLFSSNPYQLGYNVLGPVVSAFCQWLIEQAQTDHINELYFLAREGKLVKQIYDLWSSPQKNTPQSHYLQVSRRCVTVPAINSFEDIIDIAEKNYCENSIQNYLIERFGLSLDAERWKKIYQKNLWDKDKKLIIKQKQIDHIKPLLEYLQTDILNLAQTEKLPLMTYLKTSGLFSSKNSAVVDVGYSGTIQQALNKLSMQPIHGYYFATIIPNMKGLTKDIKIKGCYVNNLANLYPDSQIFARSFELEKLLSADDTQIIKYCINDDMLKADFKNLSDRELATRPIRNALQQGAIDFVKDAVNLRKNFYFDFKPSLFIADSLYKDFCLTLRIKKNKVLENLILDDDYCGRGLVS